MAEFPNSWRCSAQAFGVTPGEFTDAYIAGFGRNRMRTREEDKTRYEDKIEK